MINVSKSSPQTSNTDYDRLEKCQKIIAHPVACELFKDHMIRRHNEENLMFYIAVEHLNSLDSRQARQSLSRQITKRFMNVGSVCEINISDELRGRFKTRLRRRSEVDLFKEVCTVHSERMR